jgi:NAD(P)-dependent dehydrogenase (short-subunit alcohol dehydrogenase family)
VTVSPRIALVTGGAAGLGEAAVRLLALRGWHVFIADLDYDGARASAKALPAESATALKCDVSSSASAEDAINEIEERFGRLDVLVNNAGIVRPAASHGVSDDNWEALLNVHLGGTFRMSRAAIRLLVRSDAAAIVNISSVCAARGFPGRLSYNAAKAAIEAVTRTLAVEWGVVGVRVNAVAPGFILTATSQRLYESGAADAKARVALTPLGRMGTPDEIAEAVYWLASDRSSYVTGHVLAVDGGYLIDGRTGPDPVVLDGEQLRAQLEATR